MAYLRNILTVIRDFIPVISFSNISGMGGWKTNTARCLILWSLMIDPSLGGLISGYLYEGDENTAPVVDYVKGKGEKDDKNKPSFLYSEENGPRIVEFYSPWCPHCQKFKPVYISSAKKILELSSLPISFYAVSCQKHHDICKDRGVHGYPTVNVYKAGSMEGETLKHTSKGLDPIKILQLLDIQPKKQDETSDTTPQEPSKPPVPPAPLKPNSNTPQKVAFEDASLSLHFSLQTGIFMEAGPLSNTKKQAFQDWITLLNSTLPPTFTAMHTMLHTILRHIDTASRSQPALQKILKGNEPDPDTWSPTCTKGTSYLGYTCGLWQLFHIMTVGVIEWNEKNGAERISTVHAADVLRNFIANFFGCAECQSHFLAMYDSCSHDRCNRLTDDPSTTSTSWKQLPLWLWEVHNDVNTRLASEEAQRQNKLLSEEDKQNAVWPSKHDCKGCWNDDHSWNEDVVYEFLHNYYWPRPRAPVYRALRPLEQLHRHQNRLFRAVSDIRTRSSPSVLNPPKMYESKATLICAFSCILFLLGIFRIKKWKKVVSGRHKKMDTVFV